MEIYRLAYMSTILIEQTSEQMLQMLMHARENNQQSNITSVLIDGQGLYIQVLEGDKNAVKQLFETIKLDKRHGNVSLVFSEMADKRRFKNWCLRYLRLNQTRLDRTAGFVSFIEQYHRDNIVLPGSPMIYEIQQLSEESYS